MNHLQTVWNRQRVFIGGVLNRVTEENKAKRLNEEVASAGFLALHTAEAIHLICNMVFSQPYREEITIGFHDIDEGRDISLQRIQDVLASADEVMDNVFDTFTTEKWEEVIDSPFGKISRLEGLGFLMYHTSYHIGQINLTIKKGK